MASDETDDVGKEVATSKAIATSPPKGHRVNEIVHAQQTSDLFNVLVVFRIINSLCIATFFQPDEYFQSLEPAWQLAFGSKSGAWITWEWHHQLRSSLHPALFGLFYFIFDNLSNLIVLVPQARAIVLILMPRLYQGIFAAVGDWCTWQLAERVYGPGSNTAWTVLALTCLSPWQWFVSTRTFSNSLETVLTIGALYFWPWELSGEVRSKAGEAVGTPEMSGRSIFRLTSVRACFCLAGFACILRPTNLLIWAPLVVTSISRIGLTGPSPVNRTDFVLLFKELILCGAAVLAVSAISDVLYFGMWTFPPYQWLTFNITQSLAIFYGTNDWHYYVSQGLPLLLTTALPFAAVGLWSSCSVSYATSPFVANLRFQLSFAVLTMLTTLSFISHKEVRFIYPLLPCLHLLAAPHVLSFFTSTHLTATAVFSDITIPITFKNRSRLFLLIALIITNIGISFYVTQVHQRGVISVLGFLRHEYEVENLSERDTASDDNRLIPAFGGINTNETFAAFLMPCHSTPWRSHLVYPNLNAWALTCEPPIHIPANSPERTAYRDEADRFYDDPMAFLKNEVNSKEKPWPRYIVGFEGIGEVLNRFCEKMMPGVHVREKWSGFNTHWIDDGRRAGRVIVWEFVDQKE